MTYRNIDISDETPQTAPDQPAPLLQWVKIAHLVVDETYQRSLSRQGWKAIRRIAGAFDWSHFGTLLVAPIEGGRFAIIDGQHRAHAAAICGIESLPCVVSVLPVSQQARAFAVVNSSTIRVTPLQVFRAALASEEAWAISARDAVAAGGGVLMSYNPNAALRKTGQIYAVQLVRGLVEAGQGRVIRAALPPLNAHAEAMGPMSGIVLYREDVLRPWFTAIAARPEFVHADLAGFLRKHRLMNLLEAAARLRNFPEHAKTPVPVLKRDAIVARLQAFMAEGVAA